MLIYYYILQQQCAVKLRLFVDKQTTLVNNLMGDLKKCCNILQYYLTLIGRFYVKADDDKEFDIFSLYSII